MAQHNTLQQWDVSATEGAKWFAIASVEHFPEESLRIIAAFLWWTGHGRDWDFSAVEEFH